MVNILSVKVDEEELNVSDFLKAMFQRNKELLEKLNEPLKVDLDTREGQRKLRELLWYTIEELFEAVNLLKNSRNWVQTEYEIDYYQLLDEIADTLGFLITVLRYLGLDAKKTYELFLRKWKVNMFRIESKY